MRAPAKARQVKSYWRVHRTPSFLAPRFPRGNSKQGKMLRERRAGLLYKQTHPSIPGACLGTHDSAGRAVRRLRAKRRGWERKDLTMNKLDVKP